jgi:hypothetical protein
MFFCALPVEETTLTQFVLQQGRLFFSRMAAPLRVLLKAQQALLLLKTALELLFSCVLQI